jgi:hypothetical protein
MIGDVPRGGLLLLMRTLRVRKAIAALSLVAYTWLGLGIGAQFVYCVGSDGHSGIERAHGISHGAAHTDEASLTAPETCTDIPLLLQAAKEQTKLSLAGSVSEILVPHLISPVSPDNRRNTVSHSSDPSRERLASIRSTVLRI